MARKAPIAAALEGIENIPPKPKPKARAKPAAKAVATGGVKKKTANRKVAQIYYEFKICNRSYSGFYTYKEFMDHCVKCLRQEMSFMPKQLLTERAKKIWEEKASEEGPHVVLKKPTQVKAKAKASTQPATGTSKPKRKNSKTIDLYEEADNFYDWNDDDAAVTSASTKPPQRPKKAQTSRKPPTTSAPQKLDFFLNDLDSNPAEIGSTTVIQKYRTMLGNEFIPLDSSSPQVPVKRVPLGRKVKQPSKQPLTTMIELVSS